MSKARKGKAGQGKAKHKSTHQGTSEARTKRTTTTTTTATWRRQQHQNTPPRDSNQRNLRSRPAGKTTKNDEPQDYPKQTNLEDVYALAALRIGVIDHEQLSSLGLVVHSMRPERRSYGKPLQLKPRRFGVLLTYSHNNGGRKIGNVATEAPLCRQPSKIDARHICANEVRLSFTFFVRRRMEIKYETSLLQGSGGSR